MMNKKPTPHSLFLVSGGAKGITAQCVIEVAQRYQSAFILMGRSPAPAGPEPDWSTGAADEKTLKQRAMEHLKATGERPTPKRVRRMVKGVRSQREIVETLRAIEDAGGRAVYASADVTDAAAVREGVEATRQQLAANNGGTPPQITGIIHGAGVIADKPIEQKTEADFDLVTSVKVDGLKNLLDCAPPGGLEHLLLFSSIAGFYGNVGQADYALANEILNKTAHQIKRRHPDCRVLAFDWGPWDGGMVTPVLKRLLARRDIEVIPIETGRAIFADAVASDNGEAQLVVGNALARPARTPDDALRTHRVRRRLTLDANPFLRDHVIGGRAVLPTVCAVAWVVNTAEQLYPGYTFVHAENYKALKGIVFDETLADEHVLELEETAKSSEEITFAALIRSQTADGKPRFHYRVEVTLRKERPAPPQQADIDVSTTHRIDGAALYGETILFHGPSFQGVDQVLNMSPDSLTIRCVLPEVSVETQGQFPVQTFNPYLTDVTLQSLLIWAHQTHGHGGLPLSIQKGEQYRPLPFAETLYATLTVQSSTRRHLVADVVVHDAAGQVYSQVMGAEITLSPRLNQLFAQNRLGGQA
jgi:NAD(P)-dependent dehydrogenase (short-subunit alcohol dehydrogenase family)